MVDGAETGASDGLCVLLWAVREIEVVELCSVVADNDIVLDRNRMKSVSHFYGDF